MTRVYRVSGDFDYLSVNLDGDEAARRRFRQAQGPQAGAGWVPLPLETVTDRHAAPPLWVATDCPHFGARHLLLSRAAITALDPLIGRCGEYLPVRAEFGDYAIFNCLTELDAFDPDRTEGNRMESGFFTHIDRYALRAEALDAPPPIFFLVGRRAPLLATEALHQAVAEHQLTGFVFEPVWSPETGGVPIPRIEPWDSDPAASDRARAEKCRALLAAAAARGRILVSG